MRRLLLTTCLATSLVLTSACGDDDNPPPADTTQTADTTPAEDSTTTADTSPGEDASAEDTATSDVVATEDTVAGEDAGPGEDATGDTTGGEDVVDGPGLLGCAGPTGSCEGLTGDACSLGVTYLGCDYDVEVTCSRAIRCITALDGCPFDFCDRDGDACFFKSGVNAQQEACSDYTRFSECAANNCQPNVPAQPTYICLGSWSCELSFEELEPEDRPAAGTCESFAPYGFACEDVTE